jgi:predicted dehydrogenase
MTETLGVGMIGYGFMGKMHTYSYASLPFIYNPMPARIRLVGVCAATEASRALAVDTAGFEFSSADYHDLLDRDDISIINVCTPNYLHYEQAMAAMRAGKHVYCDKPLAMNAEQAQEMAELAHETGLTCQVTFHNRFSPAMLRAKQMVDDGFLGDPVSFRSVYLHSGYTNPNRPISWRMQHEKSGGGALADLGSHAIDLLRFLIGDFKSVSARLETYIKERPVSAGSTETVPVTVDDLAILTLESENGAIGTVEASRLATGTVDDLKFEIHGTRGALSYDLMNPNWLMAYDDTRKGGAYGGDRGWQRLECVQNYPKPAILPGGKAPVGWMRLHMASMYDFICNVVAGRPGCPSFDDGLAVQRILDASALSSADNGRRTVVA